MVKLNETVQIAPKSTENSLGNRKGGITIVYHVNGKRIAFSKHIISLLGNPNRVSITFSEHYLFLMPQTEAEKGFALKKMGKSHVIYNSGLIREILDHFGIEYSDNFCQTFSDIEETDGDAIAIKMVAKISEGTADEDEHI